MSFRQGLVAASCLMLAALPAAAQIEDSGLELVNPWGMSFLEAGEPSLPTDMWAASNADDLLPLMRDVRTRALTPAERTLMRRMALSPARRPSGAQEPLLRAERARIMFELGEARAAAALMARLDEPPPGLDADEITADLTLALGNEASACGMLSDPDHQGDYWAKLRAVCAALSGNTAGAELAIEMALSQGVEDTWLLNAVFAASGELPDPPEANYRSGLALAISTEAGLQPPEDPLPENRPDLAAAMADRESLPQDLRVKAAGMAAEAGLISTADYRALFEDLLADPDFTPSGPLETALYNMRDPFLPMADRAASLVAALENAADSPAHFVSVSNLLLKDIAALPLDEDTAPYALVFARAAIAAGDFDMAHDWTTADTMEGAQEDGGFDSTFLKALTILAGEETSDSTIAYTGDRLVEQASTDHQKLAANRLFALWSAFDIPAPASGRQLMKDIAEADSEPAYTPPVLATLAAAEAGAAGEVILSTVGYTNGDPTILQPVGMVLLLEAIQRIDAEDAARQLALEASGYWKIAH